MATPNIPKTMKGLQIVEFKKPYQLSHDIPVPKIVRDSEVLIKIAVAGYCHTDKMVQNGLFRSKLPVVPSHEAAGTVVAVGSGVTNLKVGDRVASLTTKFTCGECGDCTRGYTKYCSKADKNGLLSNGAAAEYMTSDSKTTIRLPSNVSFDAAAPLMCAGISIYGGLKTAGLKSGQTVAIIGLGALGHLGIQFAKCMGLRVVAVDSRQAPLDLVKKLKYAPDYTIDSTRGVEFALKEIGGEGVDATIMAADAIAACDYGVKLTRKHGTFVVVGQPLEPIPIHYVHLIFRNLTVKGWLLGEPEMAKEMIDFVAEKGIEVKTHAYSLEDIETLMTDGHKGDHCGKSIIRVSQDA